MGAGQSKGTKSIFLVKSHELNWEDYAELEWRSERVRDLDKWGGLSRPAIPRGASVTAKLQFLQGQVKQQQEQIQAEFERKNYAAPPRGEAPTRVGTAQQGTRSGNDAEGGSSNVGPSAPSSTATRVRRPPVRSNTVQDLFREAHKEPPKRQRATGPVAPWRVRVHDARRRVFMTVLYAIRLRAGLKHPRRLRRIDSFSYYIPAVLNDDLKRFVCAVQKYGDVRAKLEADAAARDEAEAAAVAAARAALEAQESSAIAAAAAAATAAAAAASRPPSSPTRAARRGPLQRMTEPGNSRAPSSMSMYSPAPHPPALPPAATPVPAAPTPLPGGGPAALSQSVDGLPLRLGTPTTADGGVFRSDSMRRSLPSKLGNTSGGSSSGEHATIGLGDRASSPLPRKTTLQSLPNELYEAAAKSPDPAAAGGATFGAFPLPDPLAAGRAPMTPVLQPLVAEAELTGGMMTRGSLASGFDDFHGDAPTSPSTPVPTEPPVVFVPGAKSKFGFTPAHNRALAPKRVRELLDKRGARFSEASGEGGGMPAYRHSSPNMSIDLPPRQQQYQVDSRLDHLSGPEAPVSAPLVLVAAAARPPDGPQSSASAPLTLLPPGAGGSSNSLQQQEQEGLLTAPASPTTSSSGGWGESGGGSPQQPPAAHSIVKPALQLQAALPSPPSNPNTALGSARVRRRVGLSNSNGGAPPTKAVAAAAAGAAAAPKAARGRQPAAAAAAPVPPGSAAGSSRRGLQAQQQQRPGTQQQQRQQPGPQPPPQQQRQQPGTPQLGRESEAAAMDHLAASASHVLTASEEFNQELADIKEKERLDEIARAQRELEEAWEAELAVTEEVVESVDDTQGLESVEKLMAMYVNRGNAAWASGGRWGPPSLWDKAGQDAWTGTEDWNVWKARLVHVLRAGGLAVQLLAADEVLSFPGQARSYDLWTSDPWDLVYYHRPQSFSNRIPGVSLGCRILINLATAAEAVAGRDASRSLQVILHLASDQLDTAVGQIRAANFCGLRPENLIFFVQKKRYGYRYDESAHRFVLETSGSQETAGSGAAMMQLNWVAEGKRLGKDGLPHTMLGTALEALEDKNVEWLVSHRVSDLGLLSRESCLDLVLLPCMLAAHKAGVATAAVQVFKADGLGPAARTNGSVVMAPADRERYGGKAAAAAAASLPVSHPAHGLQPVAELRASELHAGSMKDVVRAGKYGGGLYLLGMDRYVFNLAALKAVMPHPQVFRPKLHLGPAGAVHVRMDLGDVVSAEGLRTVAMKARLTPRIIAGPMDLEDLVPLLRAQDAHSNFRRMVTHRGMGLSSALSSLGPGGGGEPPLSARQSPAGSAAASSHSGLGDSGSDLPRGVGAKVGRTVVVFVTSNNVSGLAVEAALAIVKPGRDTVHLVTVVSGHMYAESGNTVLDAHYRAVARALVEARQEVLVLDPQEPALISTMESYVNACGADLVVMASKAVNSHQLQSSAILGSVTLAAVKRLQCPVLVVNANSLNVQDSLKQHTVRAMALVNRNSQSLVQYMCGTVLQPRRGDALVLCQVEDTGRTAARMATGAVAGSLSRNRDLMAGRLISSLQQTATMAGLGMPPLVQIEAEAVDDITRVINRENVHVLGYLLTNVNSVPPHLVHLIHSSRAAVLVYKNKPV